MNIIVKVLKRFFNAFFTHRCHLCRSVTEFRTSLCNDCAQKISKVMSCPKPVFDTKFKGRILTLSSYDGLVSDAIKIVKYKPSKCLLNELIQICLDVPDFEEFFRSDDVLVPAPMHYSRQKKRGFNQAAEIAKAFARKFNCQYAEPLIRVKAVKAQAECTEKERRTNLENVFAISDDYLPEKFYGRRIIIIDDVATTGTTLLKCSQQLEALNPSEIIALVITHSYKKK
ncbi:MAG: phosphoribosyltransferase family protein [Candidatus Riflebacteria bacterium]|nr:phosphoribosyltransferase family protein [Candidatus Riflebacteria bacterium]